MKRALLEKPKKATGALADNAAALSSVILVNPLFTADVAGVYMLSLVVNDGQINCEPVTVTATSKTCRPWPTLEPSKCWL
jgi:hypothetical protein